MDHRIGRIIDGYTGDEMVKVSDYFLTKGAEHDMRERMQKLIEQQRTKSENMADGRRTHCKDIT